VRGLVDLIEGQGSTMRCGAEVTRIVVEAGRARGVELAGGERIAADIVVSNADAAWTYRHLVAPEHRRRWTDARIGRSHHSMSLFVWYFGTRRQWHDVPHHMIVLGPRYKGLLRDIFGRRRLADDFSLYLHRPGATDLSVAPAGHDAFYVLSPVPHLGAGVDWSTHAPRYRDAIAEALERTVLPGLRESIVTSFWMTPQDFQDRLLSYQGAAFGFEPRFTQSAWFRPHNRSEDVEGLFLVGASNHPGAGIPGVLSSAKALEAVLPDAAMFRR
jgi:phytoene desaturase